MKRFIERANSSTAAYHGVSVRDSGGGALAGVRLQLKLGATPVD
jgi:hypothetical protein